MDKKERATTYLLDMAKALGLAPAGWSWWFKPNGDLVIADGRDDLTVIPHAEWDEKVYLKTDMNEPSNLPPGVSPEMMDREAGTDEKGDDLE